MASKTLHTMLNAKQLLAVHGLQLVEHAVMKNMANMVKTKKLQSARQAQIYQSEQVINVMSVAILRPAQVLGLNLHLLSSFLQSHSL